MGQIEYVATTADLNVRTSPDMSNNVIAEVKKGYQVLRIDTCGKAWSKVIYNGCVRYMGTQYLIKTTYNSSKDVSGTTVNGIKFTRVNETVKTTESLNIRTGAAVSYNKIGEFGAGDDVTRIGIGSNGWSQIIYNDKVYYVNSSYLTNKDLAETNNDVYYTTDELNVRSGSSVSYGIIGVFNKNEAVVSLGKLSNGWHKVKFGDKTGYVNGYYLSKTRSNDTSYPLTYQDGTCKITVYKEWHENAYVYAAHITFTDYDRLWVECAKGKYNSGKETTSNAAKRVGAILAINGDYATPGNGASGYAIARKGVVCNDKKTYAEGVYNSKTGMLLYGQNNGIGGQQLSELVKNGKVTDTFQFGPVVLLNGKINGDKNSTSRAQRTFIGTNGKAGDIWLCVSDGRKNDGKSAGLNGYECATYLQSKGCTLGVPLDGGGSSTIYFNGKVLNAAKSGQRAVADFVCFK